jgi:hypothetical protein
MTEVQYEVLEDITVTPTDESPTSPSDIFSVRKERNRLDVLKRQTLRNSRKLPSSDKLRLSKRLEEFEKQLDTIHSVNNITHELVAEQLSKQKPEDIIEEQPQSLSQAPRGFKLPAPGVGFRLPNPGATPNNTPNSPALNSPEQGTENKNAKNFGQNVLKKTVIPVMAKTDVLKPSPFGVSLRKATPSTVVKQEPTKLTTTTNDQAPSNSFISRKNSVLKQEKVVEKVEKKESKPFTTEIPSVKTEQEQKQDVPVRKGLSAHTEEKPKPATPEKPNLPARRKISSATPPKDEEKKPVLLAKPKNTETTPSKTPFGPEILRKTSTDQKPKELPQEKSTVNSISPNIARRSSVFKNPQNDPKPSLPTSSRPSSRSNGFVASPSTSVIKESEKKSEPQSTSLNPGTTTLKPRTETAKTTTEPPKVSTPPMSSIKRSNSIAKASPEPKPEIPKPSVSASLNTKVGGRRPSVKTEGGETSLQRVLREQQEKEKSQVVDFRSVLKKK